jgi:hypothetical protein
MTMNQGHTEHVLRGHSKTIVNNSSSLVVRGFMIFIKLKEVIMKEQQSPSVQLANMIQQAEENKIPAQAMLTQVVMASEPHLGKERLAFYHELVIRGFIEKTRVEADSAMKGFEARIIGMASLIMALPMELDFLDDTAKTEEIIVSLRLKLTEGLAHDLVDLCKNQLFSGDTVKAMAERAKESYKTVEHLVTGKPEKASAIEAFTFTCATIVLNVIQLAGKTLADEKLAKEAGPINGSPVEQPNTTDEEWVEDEPTEGDPVEGEPLEDNVVH